MILYRHFCITLPKLKLSFKGNIKKTCKEKKEKSSTTAVGSKGQQAFRVWDACYSDQYWNRTSRSLHYIKDSFPQFIPLARSSNSGRTEQSAEEPGILPRSPWVSDQNFDLFGVSHETNTKYLLLTFWSKIIS